VITGVDFLTVAVSIVLGVVVPWTTLAMLTPALESSQSAITTNFRGHRVFYGLGIVWLVWAGCAIVGGVLASATTRGGSALAVLTLMGPLALVAFALGVVDDAYGAGDTKGFRGHLAAMAAGRLTTGGLKLIGIGSASLVVALVIAGVAPWGAREPTASSIALAVAAGAAIALTSNFVNLTDLRPGRALKTYAVLATLGAFSAGLGLSVRVQKGTSSRESLAIDLLCLLIFVLGPLVAAWRYDLRELGMLGDAGANPMGAVAGALIVSGLPAWGVIVYLAVMLALNLASEKLSFSRVIESNAMLRRLDGVGRLPFESRDSVAKSSPYSEKNPE